MKAHSKRRRLKATQETEPRLRCFALAGQREMVHAGNVERRVRSTRLFQLVLSCVPLLCHTLC